MKPFPFKPIRYRQYRNTFLQNVIVSFEFTPSTKKEDILKDLFHDYVQSFFGIDTKGGDISKEMCNISKKDMSQIFLFSNGKASILLSGKQYETFSDTAIPQIFKLRSFFTKVMEVYSLKNVSIRKINVWDFKNSDKKEVDVDEVKDLVFSPGLLMDLSTENLEKQEMEIPNFSKCSYSQNDEQIDIRTALLPPTSKDDFSHLILDTLGVVNPGEGIKVEEMADVLMDLNSYLFYSYHWSVSDYVLNVMNEENKK